MSEDQKPTRTDREPTPSEDTTREGRDSRDDEGDAADSEHSTLREERSTDDAPDLSQFSTLRRGPDRIPEGEPRRLDVDRLTPHGRRGSEEETVESETSTLTDAETTRTHSDEPTVDHDASTMGDRSSPEPGRASEPDAMPTLPERYTLGVLIGEGGMARVFEAFDARLKRPVAIKCMKGDANDHDLVGRFRDEVAISASLQHPGTVPVYDTGTLDADESFYVMKRVRGSTLGELLDQREPKQIEDPSEMRRFVDLFERVCQTVAAAHSERIIHRDLKPSNIMVDDFGAVYVMDWGLAKHLDRTGEAEHTRTRHGAILGTPAYMSPEQASGRSAVSETQADVFSLGVMLYEILAGYRPFGSDDDSKAQKEILRHDPDPPRKISPRVPRALSAICMKALEKDPYRRYRSAGELAEDLRAHRELREVSARPPTLFDRLRLWARRRPALAASLLTALLIGAPVLFAVGSFVASERHNLEDLQERLLDQRGAIADLDRQMAELRGRLSALPDGPERRRLELDFEQLDAQRHIASIDTIGILGSIREIAIVHPDAWLIPEIQAFVLNEMQTDLDNDRPVRALAIADAVLEGERSDRLGIDAILGDIERLQAEAREMLERRLEGGAGNP